MKLLIFILVGMSWVSCTTKNPKNAKINEKSNQGAQTVNKWTQYKKPESISELKKLLSDEQFKVTQKDGTEAPFKNEYWDNKEPGLYVDLLSGEPLFLSSHKYKSGTGWPSFYKSIAEENIVELKDRKLFRTRTEVRSKYGKNHLGHVFADGPEPTGQRYCINSAALKFIPKNKMKELGYSDFLKELN